MVESQETTQIVWKCVSNFIYFIFPEKSNKIIFDRVQNAGYASCKCEKCKNEKDKERMKEAQPQ